MDYHKKALVLRQSIPYKSVWGDDIVLPEGKYRMYVLSKRDNTYTLQHMKTGKQFALSLNDIEHLRKFMNASVMETRMKKVQEAHFNFKTLRVTRPTWLVTIEGKSRKLTPDVYDIRTYKASDDSYIVSGDYGKYITYGEYIEELIADGDAYLEESMRIDKRAIRESKNKKSEATNFTPPFDVDWWQERDRASVVVTDARGRDVAEWWDEDVYEMVQDGFFKWEDDYSVLEYLKSVGVIRTMESKRKTEALRSTGNPNAKSWEEFVYSIGYDKRQAEAIIGLMDEWLSSGIRTWAEFVDMKGYEGNQRKALIQIMDEWKEIAKRNRFESKRKKQEVGPMKGELTNPATTDVDEFFGVDVYPMEDEGYMAVMDDEMYAMEADMEPEYLGPVGDTDMSMYEPMEEVPMEVYEALRKVRKGKRMERKNRKTEAVSENQAEDLFYSYVDDNYSDADLSSRQADMVLGKMLKDLSRFPTSDEFVRQISTYVDRYAESKPYRKSRKTEAVRLDTEMRKRILMDYFMKEEGAKEDEMDLDADFEEVGRGRDVKEFSTPYGDWLVLTESEADEMVEEQFESYEMDMGIGMFTPSFQEWILDNAVDTRGWFEDAMRESYEFYVEDIRNEPGHGVNDDGEDYENRLEQEMDEAGVDDEDDYVEYLMKQYDDAKEWYKDNFGDEAFYEAVQKYGRVDWSKIAEEAISLDGRGHFLAEYDGEEIEHKYERDTFYLYRTN